MDDDDKLVGHEEAVRLFGISIFTLEKWRYRKKNRIPVRKIEGRVHYKIADLKKFVEESKNRGSVNYRLNHNPKDKPIRSYKKDETNLIGVIYEDFIPKSKK